MGRYKIVNIDANIICQKPKLAQYIDYMRENIALALTIDVSGDFRSSRLKQ